MSLGLVDIDGCVTAVIDVPSGRFVVRDGLRRMMLRPTAAAVFVLIALAAATLVALMSFAVTVAPDAGVATAVVFSFPVERGVREAAVGAGAGFLAVALFFLPAILLPQQT